MKVQQDQPLVETKQQLAKALRNQYLNQWRKKNPVKVQEYRKNYWDKKAEEILASTKNN